MKSHDRLVTTLKTLGSKHRGSFIRFVPLRFAATPIDAVGSIKRGGRYNPIGEFEILYLSKTPDTAVREIELVVVDQTTGDDIVMPFEPQILLTIDATLQNVVDLRDPTTRRSLGVSKRALLTNWENDIHETRVPTTHLIGSAAHAAGVEALIAPSAKHRGWNLNILLDNLVFGSSVRIHAANPSFDPGVITRYEGRRPHIPMPGRRPGRLTNSAVPRANSETGQRERSPLLIGTEVPESVVALRCLERFEGQSRVRDGEPTCSGHPASKWLEDRRDSRFDVSTRPVNLTSAQAPDHAQHTLVGVVTTNDDRQVFEGATHRVQVDDGWVRRENPKGGCRPVFRRSNNPHSGKKTGPSTLQ